MAGPVTEACLQPADATLSEARGGGGGSRRQIYLPAAKGDSGVGAYSSRRWLVDPPTRSTRISTATPLRSGSRSSSG